MSWGISCMREKWIGEKDGRTLICLRRVVRGFFYGKGVIL